MTPAIGWTVLFVGIGLPMLHVALTRDMIRAPDGGRCPFPPRAGWMVMVLFLGPIGWLMFLRARSRRRRADPPVSS